MSRNNKEVMYWLLIITAELLVLCQLTGNERMVNLMVKWWAAWLIVILALLYKVLPGSRVIFYNFKTGWYTWQGPFRIHRVGWL